LLRAISEPGRSGKAETAAAPERRPRPDSFNFVLDDFVPFRLSILANRLSRAVAKISQRHQIAAPEWRILSILAQCGPMSASDVVERTAMDKVRVSRAIGRLLELHHITRTADPDDRRRVILAPTNSGQVVFRKIAPRALEVEERVLGVLKAEERAEFAAILQKLEARLGCQRPAANGNGFAAKTELEAVAR